MAVHHLKLIDPDTPHLVEEHAARHFGESKTMWSVTRKTLANGLSRGVDILEINNGRMRLTVLPTRGMGVWRARVDNRLLGWESPVRGPVHPAFVPLAEPGGMGWLVGFDELMCRCGLVSNGAAEFDESGRLLYPMHGRIANLPAAEVDLWVDDNAGLIRVTGVVEETRFHFEKLRLRATISTNFNATSFSWHDRVENIGGTDAQVQMLYHTNVGHPQLDPGAHLIAPVNEVVAWKGNPSDVDPATWCRYAGPQAGRPQECYFLSLRGDDQDLTQILLRHSAGKSGVGMRFNTRQLPCFTQWKNEVALADGYVTGLEPATNLPNQRSVEHQHGRFVTLHPGQFWEAQVSLDWHLDATAVKQAEQAIADLQGAHDPVITPAPHAGS